MSAVHAPAVPAPSAQRRAAGQRAELPGEVRLPAPTQLLTLLAVFAAMVGLMGLLAARL